MTVDIEGADSVSTPEVLEQFRRASESSRWRGILGIDRAHGTKLFWKDQRACVVYEPYVRLIPKFMRNGERSPLSAVSVMAAYANVFGYSCQVLRGIVALNCGRVATQLTMNQRRNPTPEPAVCVVA